MELFQKHVEKGLQFVSKHCVQAIEQVDISKVTTLCCLLEALLFSDGAPNLKMVLCIIAITKIKINQTQYSNIF